MKRTKQNRKASAILTGDYHLQEGQPVARTDNFWEVQWNKVQFISELQQEHECPVIHSGDLFDHWKPSPMLLAKAIEFLPAQFWTVYGNHDLPQHNLELAYKCGINVLEKSGKLQVLKGNHWGQDCEKQAFYNLPKIAVWHVMTYQGKKPWPDCKDPMAAKILRKYPQYDLILTGHNHKPFVERYEGRLLVNPGSIFRTHASQEDHKPRVYLWYAETNEVEAVYLPIEENVISREHIEVKQQRDNRIDAFIRGLDTDFEVDLSFEKNLEKFFQANEVKEDVKEIILKSIES